MEYNLVFVKHGPDRQTGVRQLVVRQGQGQHARVPRHAASHGSAGAVPKLVAAHYSV